MVDISSSSWRKKKYPRIVYLLKRFYFLFYGVFENKKKKENEVEKELMNNEWLHFEEQQTTDFFEVVCFDFEINIISQKGIFIFLFLNWRRKKNIKYDE